MKPFRFFCASLFALCATNCDYNQATGQLELFPSDEDCVSEAGTFGSRIAAGDYVQSDTIDSYLEWFPRDWGRSKHPSLSFGTYTSPGDFYPCCASYSNLSYRGVAPKYLWNENISLESDGNFRFIGELIQANTRDTLHKIHGTYRIAPVADKPYSTLTLSADSAYFKATDSYVRDSLGVLSFDTAFVGDTFPDFTHIIIDIDPNTGCFALGYFYSDTPSLDNWTGCFDPILVENHRFCPAQNTVPPMPRSPVPQPTPPSSPIVSCDAATYDTSSHFCDARDGQVYGQKAFGTQIWMTQNLNHYLPENNNWCFDNDVKNCEIYGRFYRQDAAVVACPAGWHLPSKNEWLELADFMGGDSVAGAKMREGPWVFKNMDGADYRDYTDSLVIVTDDFGFSALSSGYRAFDGHFGEKQRRAYWWATDERDSSNASYTSIHTYNDELEFAATLKKFGMGVRCVKD
jgi:uncharacterized protein (TIGR02145 family)